MKVLIVGGGGREHALANAFAKDQTGIQIYVAPGNDGIAEEYPCLPLRDNLEILHWCLDNGPDIVVIGPEKPLEEGLADILRDRGIACVGPSQKAARIETSKIWAKQLMLKHNIPTAGFFCFEQAEEALNHILAHDVFPVVIKADGLASGKGVFIAHSGVEARQAIETLSFSGSGIVVEEYLSGWEASLFIFTDGTDYRTSVFAQDHKQLYDNDLGPNTGGMGAYCPVQEAEPYRQRIEEEIVKPVMKAMAEEGCPFQGFLYCGLMITLEGPKVLEFNCRLGDPEAQAVLPLLRTPFAEVCSKIAHCQAGTLTLQWQDAYSVCVVLAAKGYPGQPGTGDAICIPPEIAGTICLSGVKKVEDTLQTYGGRVLSITCTGSTLSEARDAAYRDAARIDFSGKHYRTDISMRKNIL